MGGDHVTAVRIQIIACEVCVQHIACNPFHVYLHIKHVTKHVYPPKHVLMHVSSGAHVPHVCVHVLHVAWHDVSSHVYPSQVLGHVL